MPRPAANIRTASTRTEYHYISTNSSVSETAASDGDWAYQWTTDIHPASVSVPIVDGFRGCAAWSHTVGDFTYEGGQSLFTSYFSGGRYTRYRYPDGSYWGGIRTPPDPMLAGSNLINATLVGALNKLKAQDVHLGNFFAEGHKTIEMILGTARLIARQVTSFKRKYPLDWRKVQRIQTGRLPRNLWCTIPNGWLQLQYGWSPLMSDIVGSMMAVYRLSQTQIPFVRVSKHKEGTEYTTMTMSGRQGGKVDITFKHQQKVGVFLIYEIKDPLLVELSSLGLINPAEIIWELTPYSFVVDWFLPVSTWMSALTADVGMTFKQGGQSLKTEMEFEKSGNPYGYTDTSARTHDIHAPHYRGKSISFQRTCFSGTPVPGLYVKSPLSALHAANAIALLAQAFR